MGKQSVSMLSSTAGARSTLKLDVTFVTEILCSVKNGRRIVMVESYFTILKNIHEIPAMVDGIECDMMSINIVIYYRLTLSIYFYNAVVPIKLGNHSKTQLYRQ